MKTTTFESTVLAWRVDAALGYRDAGVTAWQMTPLDELPRAEGGRGVDVASLAGDSAEVASLFLRRIKGGDFRFVSSARLVVQEYGEPDPRLGQPLEDLGPGAVVRCGPLQVCVVDAEMAESLREGLVALPFIERCESATVAAAVSGERIEAAKNRVQRINSRLYVVFFVGFAVLTVVAALLGLALEIPLKGTFGFGRADGLNALGGVVAVVPAVWLGWSLLVFPIGWRKRARAYQEYLRLLCGERPLAGTGSGGR